MKVVDSAVYLFGGSEVVPGGVVRLNTIYRMDSYTFEITDEMTSSDKHVHLTQTHVYEEILEDYNPGIATMKAP